MFASFNELQNADVSWITTIICWWYQKKDGSISTLLAISFAWEG
jgi:hypothetical protein